MIEDIFNPSSDEFSLELASEAAPVDDPTPRLSFNMFSSPELKGALTSSSSSDEVGHQVAQYRHKEPTIRGQALFVKSGKPLAPSETRKLVADAWGLPETGAQPAARLRPRRVRVRPGQFDGRLHRGRDRRHRPLRLRRAQAGKTSPVNLSTRSFNTGTRQGTTPPYAKEKTHEDFVKEVAAGPTVHRL